MENDRRRSQQNLPAWHTFPNTKKIGCVFVFSAACPSATTAAIHKHYYKMKSGAGAVHKVGRWKKGKRSSFHKANAFFLSLDTQKRSIDRNPLHRALSPRSMLHFQQPIKSRLVRAGHPTSTFVVYALPIVIM